MRNLVYTPYWPLDFQCMFSILQRFKTKLFKFAWRDFVHKKKNPANMRNEPFPLLDKLLNLLLDISTVEKSIINLVKL